MPTECISFRETGYFSDFICDYLDEKPELKPFYHRFPHIENFKSQIEEKSSAFSSETRQVLSKALKAQYSTIDASELTLQNIEALQHNNTFTITTGHQLNLFTGPLYFLYKIISTINLTEGLKAEYPDYDFVPVYWMASEDHDFDEINYFNFQGKKIQWNRTASGPVGRFDTEGLDAVYDVVSSVFGKGSHGETLKNWFKTAYLEHNNLAEATRYLANQLFKDYGLVIMDADDKALKGLFKPHMQKDMVHGISHSEVSSTNTKLEQLKYKIQVNPRQINFFYIKDGLRERIVYENYTYSVNNTDIIWNTNEFLSEIEKHPERFSPNVIMRPLYQEVILPNLSYIGGGGELAYWLQLKSSFEAHQVIFPILLLRNSVLITSRKQAEKLERLNVPTKDLFLKRDTFINKKVRKISNIDIDFSPQRNMLKEQFEHLHELAKQTDQSFLGAVKAQEVKQIKGLDALEKRLLKAQKRKLADEVSRMTELQEQLFPRQSLQERTVNFSELYLEFGEQLIPVLKAHLRPLQGEFLVLTI
ncbi:MAG: bacillithiol biosynthesis cysteine-adding enzyme BshC [Bacteroidota bacterium]